MSVFGIFNPMMRLFFLLAGIFPLLLNGQITLDKTRHDFGVLNSYDERFVDFKLTNNSPKKGFVLRVVKPSEVIYLARANSMSKDSSIYLRFQVNPTRKGRFTYTIELFLSDRQEPVELKLTGELLDAPPATGFLTDCPDFNARPGGKGYSFDLTVVTIDKETREELAQTKVTCLQNGVPLWQENTSSDGSVRKEASVGFVYVLGQHRGYKEAELGAYVNFQRNKLLLELERSNETPVEPLPEKDTIPKEDPPLLVQENKVDTSEFSEQNYKPVNVVFVLDVSSSMNQGDKMELMKYTLLQLVGMIRSCDHMGIVTYSDAAQVLVAPSSGNEKEQLRTEISGLRAAGLTAGGTGIKTGYKEVLKNYDPSTLNTLIVVTDGAFNKDSENYQKTIRKYRKKGIELHVIGVKMKVPDAQKMQEVTQLGGGTLIPVNDLSDANANLTRTIRERTFYGSKD